MTADMISHGFDDGIGYMLDFWLGAYRWLGTMYIIYTLSSLSHMTPFLSMSLENGMFEPSPGHA